MNRLGLKWERTSWPKDCKYSMKSPDAKNLEFIYIKASQAALLIPCTFVKRKYNRASSTRIGLKLFHFAKGCNEYIRSTMDINTLLWLTSQYRTLYVHQWAAACTCRADLIPCGFRASCSAIQHHVCSRRWELKQHRLSLSWHRDAAKVLGLDPWPGAQAHMFCSTCQFGHLYTLFFKQVKGQEALIDLDQILIWEKRRIRWYLNWDRYYLSTGAVGPFNRFPASPFSQQIKVAHVAIHFWHGKSCRKEVWRIWAFKATLEYSLRFHGGKTRYAILAWFCGRAGCI